MCSKSTKRIIINLFRSLPIIFYIVLLTSYIVKHVAPSATIFEIFQRCFLVESNVAFLFIPIYCIILTIEDKLNWYALIPEMILSIMTCLWSTMYHMCDSGPTSTQICAFQWESLYKLDFIFSFEIIHIVFAYSPNPPFPIFCLKTLYLTLTTVGNIIYVNTYYNGSMNIGFYACNVALGVAVTIFRFIYLWCTGDISHEMKDHFNIWVGMIALIDLAIGVFCKIATPNSFNYYWWGHAGWHIFIAQAIYFTFAMFDIRPLFCCFKGKKCPPCEAQNGTVDENAFMTSPASEASSHV